MKRLLAALLAVQFTLSTFSLMKADTAVWGGSVASAFAGGSGTEEDPFLIADGSELAYLASLVNGGGTCAGRFFLLTEDILLNEPAALNNGAPAVGINRWQPPSAAVFPA